MTMTFIMLATFNVTNVCMLINVNHAKKILADHLINRAQKDKYHLFFHDFNELTQDIFN